jgi:hypothetical protein
MRFHHLALALSVALSACAPQIRTQFAVDGPDGWSRVLELETPEKAKEDLSSLSYTGDQVKTAAK